MIQVYVLTEGRTEATMVQGLLAPHFGALGVHVAPSTVETRFDAATGRRHRGGGRWAAWRKHIDRELRLKRSPQARFTTMFDLYGLPSDFPELSSVERAPRLERANVAQGILQRQFADERLRAYVQQFEFEALVLASLDALEALLDPNERPALGPLRASIDGLPFEEINDRPNFAPSKRLAMAFPDYDDRKTTDGVTSVVNAGLPHLRVCCPRFDRWVSMLESWAAARG